MIKDKKVLAIIPARGGSKRLPRKNILPLAGKSLINWTIEAALAVSSITEVMVSTDDDEISCIAKVAGAQVPYKRSPELSGDTASSIDVVVDALNYYQQRGRVFDYVILLQPTSPLRSDKDIESAIQLLQGKKADAIVSVCPVEHSPLWSNTLPEDDSLNHFISNEIKSTRSQDLPEYYRLNGAIYICKIEKLLEQQSFFLTDNIFAYKMTTEASVDIDNHIDFLLAEALLSQN